MRDWKKNLNTFLKKYEPLFVSSFLVGSLAYGGIFKENSDIDLVVIVRDLTAWKVLCEELDPKNKNLAQESINLYLNGEARSLFLNVTKEDIKYQIDVLLPSFFVRAKSDLNRNQTIIYQRVSNTTDEENYIFGHVDKRITVPKTHVRSGSVFLVSTPLCIVKEEFYFGNLLEKLFTGYLCLTGNENQIKSFCTLGIKKMLGRGNAKSINDVIRSSVKYDRMSEEHKKRLSNLYSNQLKKHITLF